MKNIYNVQLENIDGCIFDSEEFTNLAKARKWSSGRNEIYKYGKWYKYTVHIYKNNKKYLEYKTK